MEIQIQGVKFTVPERYQQGHTISATEAAVLNQTMAENLRNNFAPRVKKLKEENGDLEALQNEFTTYAGEYQFGVRRAGGGRIGDPVERRAHKLAMDKLRERAKSQNKEYGAEQLQAMVPVLLEKYPGIREEARRQIEQEKAFAAEEVDLDAVAGASTTSADVQGDTEQVADGDGEEPAPSRRRR